MTKTMYGCSEIKFRAIKSLSNENLGTLTPIEGGGEIPFDINRVYYIYDVKTEKKRGNHAHRKLHQVLICIHGSVDIRVENFFGEHVYNLNDPSTGLYLGPDNWREMYNFTEDAVLLVLASQKYDEADYIRDYDDFREEVTKKFGGR